MWFRKAADQGDAIAEFLFGYQYANGIGVPLDYGEAMIWYRKAAEQGHAVAKLFLGIMYADGLGVPQDYVRAHMWFSLSRSGTRASPSTWSNGEGHPVRGWRTFLRNRAPDIAAMVSLS